MQKSILIIGMGQGLSLGIAEKFGSEGYVVGMISRSAEKLAKFQQQLASRNIVSAYAAADVASTEQMLAAIREIRTKLGSVRVLQYNAVDSRYTYLLDDTADALTTGFRISVANALAATQELLPDLKQNKGSVLLTGGGSANRPNPHFATVSLGKAGIKSLAYQLNEALKPLGIYVGTVTVSGTISPDSATHSPKILAQKFWDLNESRSEVELVY